MANSIVFTRNYVSAIDKACQNNAAVSHVLNIRPHKARASDNAKGIMIRAYW